MIQLFEVIAWKRIHRIPSYRVASLMSATSRSFQRGIRLSTRDINASLLAAVVSRMMKSPLLCPQAGGRVDSQPPVLGDPESSMEMDRRCSREVLRQTTESIYNDFIGKVSKGRKLSSDQVDQAARGRVWTGVDAKAQGLVDELGGFRVAVAETRKLLGLDEGAEVRLRRFPARQSQFEQLADFFGVSVKAVRSLAAVAAILDMPGVKEAQKAVEAQQSGAIRSTTPSTSIPKRV